VISPGAPLLLLGEAALTTATAAVYFARVRMPRPAVGRFAASDVAIMTVLLIALPFGYIHLATPLLVAVFGVLFLVVIQTALAPVLGSRAGLLTAVAACSAVVWAGLSHHAVALMWGNDLLIVVAVTGVVNLWVQTGLTAAQVAALSAVLAGYDLVATGLTSFTASFFGRISGEPFAPALAASHGAMPVALGLGDCLMLALWPLAAAKAFGRAAGWTGAVVGLAAVAAVEGGSAAGLVTGNVPMMTIIGPLVVAQWALWRFRCGAERTTGAWQSGAPPGPAAVSGALPVLDAALLAAAVSQAEQPGLWQALYENTCYGQGTTPGRARRAARLAGCPAVPVVLQASRALRLPSADQLPSGALADQTYDRPGSPD
jgi:hypothetical protein